MSTVPVEEEVPWYVEHGYLMGKEISDGLWICVAPMIYTWRLMICTEDYVIGFACYDKTPEKFVLVVEAFQQWDGTGLPLEGYTRTVNLGGDGEKNH